MKTWQLQEAKGKFSEVVMASEFKYFSDSVGTDTVVLAISQSGETDEIEQLAGRADGRPFLRVKAAKPRQDVKKRSAHFRVHPGGQAVCFPGTSLCRMT